jgi:predicted acyltransferase
MSSAAWNATASRASKTDTVPEVTTTAHRLESLDVLRGLTVAIMIMVNTSGDGAHTYRFLAHSRWNGCTLADVVFPCFLFMVGISSVFSISGRLSRGASRGQILRQAGKRALMIFALGLVVNGFPKFPLDTLRVFGVLQRIALCYFAVVLFLLFSRTHTIAISLFAILVGYWALLRWAPVPGLGTPGSDIPFLDPFANLPAWLDRHLVPAQHLYHQGFYDPEGLLSSVSAVASTLIGALTGTWIRSKRKLSTTARGLLIAGCICLVTGLIWSHWFPLNKRLWTSSFVLWNGGISLLTLWFFFWLIDMRHRGRTWTYPATVFGVNALTAYVFSELLASLLGAISLSSGRSLQRWLFYPFAAIIPNPSIAALAYAIAFVAVCFVPPWILYRKQIFLKI